MRSSVSERLVDATGMSSLSAFRRVSGNLSVRMFRIAVVASALALSTTRSAYPQNLDGILESHPLRKLAENRLQSARVHLSGVVTYYNAASGLIFPQTSTGTAHVAADSNAAAHTSASIVPNDASAAQQVTYAEAASGHFKDHRIMVSGLLVGQLHDEQSSTVLVNVDDHLVTGQMGQAEQAQQLPALPVGSRVEIAGICRSAAAGAWPSTPFALQMHGAEDLHLVSKPPLSGYQIACEFLAALGLAMLVVAIWAVFLKRRVQNQTAWIDRSMEIAKERSRLLEAISSNHNIDALLTEICRSTQELLPGSDCSYRLHHQGEKAEAETAQDAGTEASEILHSVALRDGSQQIVGEVKISSTAGPLTTPDRHEVYNMLSELVALAMRQSQLYRGLLHHSTHDPLTELPNRRLCESRMATALQEAEACCGQLAVIYIDINRFKQVNDQFGHKTGDLYLQAIGLRLGAQIRPIDTLARIGGDEFMVIAPFPEGFDRSHALTARLQACFLEPFNLDGNNIEGSASFGFARYPEHGTTAEELTRHADHDMYLSKHNEARIAEGAHGIAIITSDELELALLGQRFRLAYQPQFSASGRLRGLETLIRLEDPVLGVITPDAFISVAERHRVIVDIGAWTLRCALQDATRWGLHTGEPLLLAVNVAVRQLEEPGYAKSVLACLKEHHFPPERLEIELIERSLMFSGDIVAQQLEQLREAGVRISLDDFGTGQSCLSLLHRLPIDTIKLDRSFIGAMDNEPSVLPVIQAIVSMARSLGKRVVAEAIEHIGPVPTLMRMGQMDFQGYLLSRPIPSEEVPAFIDQWRSGIQMPEAFHTLDYQV